MEKYPLILIYLPIFIFRVYMILFHSYQRSYAIRWKFIIYVFDMYYILLFLPSLDTLRGPKKGNGTRG